MTFFTLKICIMVIFHLIFDFSLFILNFYSQLFFVWFFLIRFILIFNYLVEVFDEIIPMYSYLFYNAPKEECQSYFLR